jgi:hypothetical protein
VSLENRAESEFLVDLECEVALDPVVLKEIKVLTVCPVCLETQEDLEWTEWLVYQVKREWPVLRYLKEDHSSRMATEEMKGTLA